MKTRIINAPLPEVVDMLLKRMRPEAQDHISNMEFRAVGLVQLSVADIFYFADIAAKSANVYPVELSGNCPQHITTLAIFGETSAVKLAIQSIEQKDV